MADRAAGVQARIAAAGLADRLAVVAGNALEAAVQPAPTAVYLYLIERGLRAMLPHLRRLAGALPGGVLRVVTVLYRFDRPLAPVRVERVAVSDLVRTPVYLYHIAAEAQPGAGTPGGAEGLPP